VADIDRRIVELADEFIADLNLRANAAVVGFAKHYAQLEAERDRLHAALKLMSRHAEEQNLLIPLHEQRQITEALGG